MRTRLPLLLIAALAVSVGLRAADNPTIGTWKLNLAKSKYDQGPPDRSSTSKFEPSGTNGVKTTVDNVDGQGNRIHYEYTANYDGKEYPVAGSASFDSVSLRRTDPNTTISVWKKGSTVVRMLRSVVSKDGKTRTIEGVGINAQGQAYHNVTFYDNQ